MTVLTVGTHAQWDAARADLLELEKEHTRLGDELARRRRELPWVAVDKQYTLQTADGPKALAALFDGRSQLLIYHFMFGPSYEQGCPTNSSIADAINGLLPHLPARDITLMLVSGGFNAFALKDGTAYRTYSTAGRGVEFLMTYYGIQRRDEYASEQ